MKTSERARRLARVRRRHPQFAAGADAALENVRRTRGEPHEHACPLCGALAVEWQLARVRHVEGYSYVAYSEDPADYMPLCGDCAALIENERVGSLIRSDYGWQVNT